jgi:hypothetical protein
MTEPTYTIKEIMDIQFKGLDHKLDAIRDTLKEQNISAANRFASLEIEMDSFRKEIAQLREEQAKYKTVWGIGATIGASFVATIVAFTFNRIF